MSLQVLDVVVLDVVCGYLFFFLLDIKIENR